MQNKGFISQSSKWRPLADNNSNVYCFIMCSVSHTIKNCKQHILNIEYTSVSFQIWHCHSRATSCLHLCLMKVFFFLSSQAYSYHQGHPELSEWWLWCRTWIWWRKKRLSQEAQHWNLPHCGLQSEAGETFFFLLINKWYQFNFINSGEIKHFRVSFLLCISNYLLNFVTWDSWGRHAMILH